MNRIQFIALGISFLFFNFSLYSQEIPEGAIMINDNTLIKDLSGNKVSMNKLMDLMNSGDWAMDPVEDSDGKLLYLQLRKATEEEKQMRSEMPMPGDNANIIGENAPDFKMTDINGNIISSENTKGKIVVLNFWFTSCKPCIDEIPSLNKVYEKYKTNTDVVFASITFNKDEKVAAFLKKNPIKYQVVSNSKDICDLFKISGYPTNIIIDKKGNYYDYISGGNPNIGHQISNSINDAINDKKPFANQSKAKNVMLDPNSTFKLENGEIIPFDKVIGLLNSNKYTLQKKESDGKEYYLLKEN